MAPRTRTDAPVGPAGPVGSGDPSVARRRGRPTRAEGPAVTADAIVEAALEAVQANGWSGLGLREIARNLGVSLPAVQRHFPTKDHLWRACVDRLIAERMALPAPPPAGAQGAERIMAVLRAQFDRASLEPGLTSAMLSDRSEGADSRLAYLYRSVRPVLDEGRARLQGAVDSGLIRDVDLDVVLALLGIGMSSLANARPALRQLFGIDLEEESERERFAATLTDILLRGLQGPAAGD